MKLFGKPLKLVILDVDGIIIDLVAGFQKNLEAAASQSDLSAEPIHQYINEVREGKRKGKAKFSDNIQAFWPNLSTEEIKKFITSFRQEERRNPYPPIKGSADTIKWLRKNNTSVALCTTNSQEILDHRLKAAGFDQSLFDAMATGDHLFIKPDSRALDPIFEKVSIPREHAVYVGDWYPDLETARGADVRFVAALSGGIPRHAFLQEGVPEDHIVERLADLPKLIEV